MNKLVKRIHKYISNCARKKRNNRKHTVTLRKLLNKIDKRNYNTAKKKGISAKQFAYVISMFHNLMEGHL